MSALTEYLKLIPKGLANPEKILEGVINEVNSLFGNLPQDEKDEILRRRLICKACPFYSLNATTSEEYKKRYGKHYKTDRSDKHCSVCSCNENVKTSSLTSDCGIIVDKQLLDEYGLKWTAYNKTILKSNNE